MNINDVLPNVDAMVWDTLGDPVVYQGRAFRGIFSMSYDDVELGQWRTGLTEPTLQLREADMVGVARDTQIEVLGKVYTVVDIQPQGDHTSFLVLRDDGASA